MDSLLSKTTFRNLLPFSQNGRRASAVIPPFQFFPVEHFSRKFSREFFFKLGLPRTALQPSSVPRRTSELVSERSAHEVSVSGVSLVTTVFRRTVNE